MNPGGARDPHGAARILRSGARPEDAPGAVVLVHGRGGSAQGMLEMAGVLDRDDLAFVAPQAVGGSWYPYGFMEPLERNEPWLSSALALVGCVLEELEKDGVARERVVLLGFSQGGCLALEYAARHARRYGGVAGLSGGLIGPDGTPRDHPGTLEGTPVFLGCSDIDPHIPVERVHETAEVMRRLDGAVEERIYPGMGHIVNRDEVEFVRGMLPETAG